MQPTRRLALAATLASASLALLGCSSTPRHHLQPAHDPAAEAASLLTGSFSSAEQAAQDPDNFRDIRLHAVPIWTARPDGPWLYVEQAAASALDRPYRQRIYRVTNEPDGSVRSAVFTLPGDPLAFAGAWRNPERFDALSPEQLSLRQGCDVILRRQGPRHFVGATSGSGCASDLRGASYATSTVDATPDRLVTWDRGFDADANQVWGATTRGYVFLRVPTDPAP